MNDPGTFAANPTYNGIPIRRVPAFEDFCTAQNITIPPYMWVDCRFIFPVFHKNRYMEETDPIRGNVNTPFSWAVYKRTYVNLFCRSRKRHGWIKGEADES